jgi:hypothetical protein
VQNPKQLLCELCIIGYKAPQLMPDWVGLKRKAEQTKATTDDANSSSSKKLKPDTDTNNMCKDRLFLARLPLTVTKTSESSKSGTGALARRQNSGRLRICIVQLSEQDAKQAVTSSSPLSLETKKIRIVMSEI